MVFCNKINGRCFHFSKCSMAGDIDLRPQAHGRGGINVSRL